MDSDDQTGGQTSAAARVDRAARFLVKLGGPLVVIAMVYGVLVIVAWRLIGSPVDPVWGFAVLAVAGVFGPACLIAAWGLRRRRGWARRLFLVILWTGLPMATVFVVFMQLTMQPPIPELIPDAVSPARPAVRLVYMYFGASFIAVVVAGWGWLAFRLNRFWTSDEVKALFRQASD